MAVVWFVWLVIIFTGLPLGIFSSGAWLPNRTTKKEGTP